MSIQGIEGPPQLQPHPPGGPVETLGVMSGIELELTGGRSGLPGVCGVCLGEG